MFKIQVRVENDGRLPQAPEALTQWQDCIDVPELKTIEEAESFMMTQKCHDLEPYGLRFRAVPVDQPS